MSRRTGNSQSGYTQLLEGSNLVTARAVNIDMHHKHCYHIAKALRGMNAASAISYLEDVIDKKRAVPYVRRSRRGRGGNTMAGHRKGKMGPGKYPNKASKEFIKLINSAMENARQRFDTIDPEDMTITHLAAHRGQIARHFRPRAQGRATPKNHYQVNLEIFLEYFGDEALVGPPSSLFVSFPLFLFVSIVFRSESKRKDEKKEKQTNPCLFQSVFPQV